jgi:hypothetical protein
MVRSHGWQIPTVQIAEAAVQRHVRDTLVIADALAIIPRRHSIGSRARMRLPVESDVGSGGGVVGLEPAHAIGDRLVAVVLLLDSFVLLPDSFVGNYTTDDPANDAGRDACPNIASTTASMLDLNYHVILLRLCNGGD